MSRAAKLASVPVERLRLLAVMAGQGEFSPRTLVDDEAIAQSIGTVAYHVRTFAAAGLLEPTRDEQVRGAVQHFYRLTPAAHVFALTLLEVARDAEETIREAAHAAA